MDDEEFDVFISYRRVGGDWAAQEICQRFKDLGFRPFLDKAAIAGASPWNAKIVQAIASASLIVIVLSHGCLDRCKEGRSPDGDGDGDGGDVFGREITAALARQGAPGVRVFPIQVGEFEPREFDGTDPKIKQLLDLNFVHYDAFRDSAVSVLRRVGVALPEEHIENSMSVVYGKIKKHFNQDPCGKRGEVNLKFAKTLIDLAAKTGLDLDEVQRLVDERRTQVLPAPLAEAQSASALSITASASNAVTRAETTGDNFSKTGPQAIPDRLLAPVQLAEALSEELGVDDSNRLRRALGIASQSGEVSAQMVNDLLSRILGLQAKDASGSWRRTPGGAELGVEVETSSKGGTSITVVRWREATLERLVAVANEQIESVEESSDAELEPEAVEEDEADAEDNAEAENPVDYFAVGCMKASAVQGNLPMKAWIAGALGVTKNLVARRISAAGPKDAVRDVFQDWEDTQFMGAMTVKHAITYCMVSVLAHHAELDESNVESRLENAHGKTLVRNALHPDWPAS